MSDSLTAAQPQTIAFNEIPGPDTWRKPDVMIEVRPNYGNVGLLGFPAKALIMSQMLPTGAAGAGAAVAGQVYPITADGQGGALFGFGSIAAGQVAAFRRNNKTTPLFAMAVPDAVASIQATATITIGAAASGAAVISCKIAGFLFAILVTPNATAMALAGLLVSTINAIQDVPVIATNAAGVVRLYAKNAGLCGNDIDVRIVGRSDAASPVVSLAVTGPGLSRGTLSGGAGNPDISTMLATIATAWFPFITTPWTDTNNRSELAIELDRRYGALVRLDGIAFLGVNGTYGTQTSYGDAGNSKGIVTVGAAGMVEPPWTWAAAWCAVHAFRLTNDPSRQSRAIAVVGLTAPDDADVFTPQQSNLLLFNGVSTWEKLPDGTVVIDRTITGYLVSNLGVPDAAWLDVMTPATMTRIRYDWRNYVKLVYPNAKLFDDDSIGAQYDETAATPKRMDGSWASRCLQYERAGWIEGSATTVNTAKHMRNPNDKNRLDGKLQVRTAGNLMILAEALEFAA